MDEYFLVVEVLGLELLDQTMGPAVMDSTLADLSKRVSDLTTEVLSLTQTSSPAQSLRRGCWIASFSLDGKSLILGAVRECVDSISGAAQQLVNEAALAIFGASSAALASLSVTCIDRAQIQNLGSEIKLAANTAFDVRCAGRSARNHSS